MGIRTFPSWSRSFNHREGFDFADRGIFFIFRMYIIIFESIFIARKGAQGYYSRNGHGNRNKGVVFKKTYFILCYKMRLLFDPSLSDLARLTG